MMMGGGAVPNLASFPRYSPALKSAGSANLRNAAAGPRRRHLVSRLAQSRDCRVCHVWKYSWLLGLRVYLGLIAPRPTAAATVAKLRVSPEPQDRRPA